MAHTIKLGRVELLNVIEVAPDEVIEGAGRARAKAAVGGAAPNVRADSALRLG